MNSVVMAGSLLSFDVPSLLQAVSLSRQYTLIRLWDRERRPTGEIRLKAGQLIDATGGGQRGRQGLYAILRFKQHYTFRVERLTDPGNLPETIGPLARLLLSMPQAPQVAAVPVAPPAPPRPLSPSPSPVASTSASSSGSASGSGSGSAFGSGSASGSASAFPLVSVSSESAASSSGSRPVPARESLTSSHPTESGTFGALQSGVAARVEPRRIAMGAMPSEVLEVLERVDGLLVVLVINTAQARCFARWHRATVPVSLSALAGFATRWLLAYRQSFGSAHGPPQGTLKLSEGTFVLEPVSEARLVGYLFASHVPAGLVRWRVGQLSSPMSRFHLEGELESGGASISSSSLSGPAVTA